MSWAICFLEGVVLFSLNAQVCQKTNRIDTLIVSLMKVLQGPYAGYVSYTERGPAISRGLGAISRAEWQRHERRGRGVVLARDESVGEHIPPCE